MRITVAAVGRIKERGLRDAVDDYARRVGRYARYDELEIRDGSDDEVRARFQKAIPERAKVVALEVDGKPYTSPDLARFVERCEGDGVQSVVFLIGGAYGLPGELSKGADLQLSLSRMTLPHRLARLVLLEQIYRAFTISRNEPYSH